MSGLAAGNYRIKLRRVFYQEGSYYHFCYLRVTYKGDKKYFQINDEPPFAVTLEGEQMELNRMEIIERITEPREIRRPIIKIIFEDNKGYEVTMKTHNLSGFEHILKEFPRLKKALEE